MIDKDKIKEILSEHLTITRIEIQDDSDLHRNHPEAQKSGGGHYTCLIVSDDFTGMSLIKRHRLVYNALKDFLKNEIHALSIQAVTAQEVHR